MFWEARGLLVPLSALLLLLVQTRPEQDHPLKELVQVQLVRHFHQLVQSRQWQDYPLKELVQGQLVRHFLQGIPCQVKLVPMLLQYQIG